MTDEHALNERRTEIPGYQFGRRWLRAWTNDGAKSVRIVSSSDDELHLYRRATQRPWETTRTFGDYPSSPDVTRLRMLVDDIEGER